MTFRSWMKALYLTFAHWFLGYSELSRFIASGRLHCTIDKVHGVVETNRPAVKQAQYDTVVRQGDLLLSSVQRLSKVLY